MHLFSHAVRKAPAWGSTARGRMELPSWWVRCSAVWMLALILSLALSPLLSRMHQVAHPGHGVSMALAQTVHAPDAGTPMARSALDRLFGLHTEGSSVCQGWDHSSSAEGAQPAGDLPLLAVPALLVLGLLPQRCAIGLLAYFQARGPPAVL